MNFTTDINKLRNQLKEYALVNKLTIDINKVFNTYNKKQLSLVKIIGIENEPYYCMLNNKDAVLINIGKDTVTIASRINIRLKYKYNGQSEGFSYKGIIKTQNGAWFKYSVPKKNAYRKFFCAVAINKGMKPKTYNYCTKVLCSDGDYMYIQLVTYSPKVAVNKKIIGVHESYASAHKILSNVLNTLEMTKLVINRDIFIESEEGESFEQYDSKSLAESQINTLEALKCY